MTKGNDFAPIGFVHGADIWVRSLVARIGPENLHVISYVRSQHCRRVFGDFVFEALLGPAGVPRENIHFTDARTGPWGKGKEFLRHKLNVFIDDNSDVLYDIAWADRSQANSLIRPRLFLVPTRYHNPGPKKRGSSEERLRNCQYQVNQWPKDWGSGGKPFAVKSLEDVLQLLQ